MDQYLAALLGYSTPWALFGFILPAFFRRSLARSVAAGITGGIAQPILFSVLPVSLTLQPGVFFMCAFIGAGSGAIWHLGDSVLRTKPLQPSTPSPTSSATTSARVSIQPTPSIAEEHWAVALREYASGERSSGLFARLFAECGGDETKIKVAYLKERAHSLAIEAAGRTTPSEGAGEPTKVLQPTLNLSEEAASLGITCDGDCYCYKTYRFES